MPKMKLTPLVIPVVKRVCNPGHVAQAISLHRNRKKERRVVDDAQLQLYAQILPREFLHFAYFENADTAPEDISLNELLDAQHHYAEQFIGLVTDKDRPVLDIGCGMGVISSMLQERGFSPVALTPDRYQIAHIKSKYDTIPSLHTKFEDLDAADHAGKYGTLLNAESFQYLKLDRALPLVDKLLAPGGKWIICDYFYREPQVNRSPHHFDGFLERLKSMNFVVASARDITANVLPTLKYIHMWASRFGLPLMEFATMKLRKKQPGVHHLIEPGLAKLRLLIDEQLRIIDPVCFAQLHQYMLLEIQRA